MNGLTNCAWRTKVFTDQYSNAVTGTRLLELSFTESRRLVQAGRAVRDLSLPSWQLNGKTSKCAREIALGSGVCWNSVRWPKGNVGGTAGIL